MPPALAAGDRDSRPAGDASAPPPLESMLAYADRLRSLPANELANELAALGDPGNLPVRQFQLALVLMHSHQPADTARALGLMQRVMAHPAPESAPLKPLARLLAARLLDQRRLEDGVERQSQQLRDAQRRNEQLNERLASFLGTLTEAHEGYSESVESARTFNQQLREQVSGLQASVQDAVDLPTLKQSLEARLEGLLSTVSGHQKHRDGYEEQVAQRLQSLTQKVADMEQEAQMFRDHLEEQRQKALIDPLTGLPNRAGWSERLELEMARWKRYGGELLLAVLDIDHFKRINDGYGHLAGDKVLKIIAGELAKRLRKTDFIARFGGEEFVLLIPSTPLEGGHQLLQTLLDGVEQCPFHFRGERVTITLSAGLTAFASGEDSDKVFERADQALYRAKSGGRNRVELN